jgi:hypothetical protein
MTAVPRKRTFNGISSMVCVMDLTAAERTLGNGSFIARRKHGKTFCAGWQSGQRRRAVDARGGFTAADKHDPTTHLPQLWKVEVLGDAAQADNRVDTDACLGVHQQLSQVPGVQQETAATQR